MVDWLKNHVFIAAWASPLIALIGLLVKKTPPGTAPPDWSRVMVYVGFLTGIAVIVTPGIDSKAQEFFRGITVVAFGVLVFDIGRSAVRR